MRVNTVLFPVRLHTLGFTKNLLLLLGGSIGFMAAAKRKLTARRPFARGATGPPAYASAIERRYVLI